MRATKQKDAAATTTADRLADLNRQSKDLRDRKAEADKFLARLQGTDGNTLAAYRSPHSWPDGWPAEYGEAPATLGLAVRFVRRRSEDLLRDLEAAEDRIHELQKQQRREAAE